MRHLFMPVAAACLATVCIYAQAQEAAFDFNIPAQPLSQVINALSKQTGLQPFFTEDSVKGVQSPGVKGKYSLREALDKALVGTGLSYQFTAEKAVAIKGVHAASKLNDDYVAQLQEVVITATKSEILVSDSPAAVTVITKKAISDRNVSRITDALGVTPSLFMGGAMDGQMNGGTGVSSITLRGMDTSRIGVLVDGQSLMDSYTNKIDFRTIFTDDVERVEIVPGPFSSLYGSNAIGGVINIITKQPTEKETTLRVKRGFGDAAGNDVSLYYRNKFDNGLGIVAGLGYQDREGYVNEFVVRSPVAGAAGTPVSGAIPSTSASSGQPAYIVGDKGKVPWTQMNTLVKLTYDLSPRTKIYGGLAYNTYTTGYSPYNTYLRDVNGNSVPSGTLGINGQRVTLAESAFATNTPMEQGDLRYYGGFEGIVDQDYKLKLELSKNIKRNWYNAVGTGGTFAGGNGTFNTTPNETLSGLAQLSFPLGNSHYLVTGFNVNRESLINKESWTLANWRDTASKTSIIDGSSGESTTISAFAQDEIALNDALTLYVGARFDSWKTSGSNFKVGTGAYNNTYSQRSDSAFSPKLSAVFRATNELTLRTSVGQSFRAPNPNELYTSLYCAACSGGRYFFNDPSLKPEIATTWEFGGDWRPTDKVRTTASVYQTNIKDMIYSKALSTTTAPATGPDEVKVNSGEAQVKGIELTGGVKLMRWLEVFLSYSYIDSEVLKNDADPRSVGKRLINVPENLMTIGWNLNYGPWSGVLETRYAGKVFTTARNTDTTEGVPGSRSHYTLTNVKASYQFDKSFKASLAINNLTNANIYQDYLMPGRNLTAEVAMSF